MSDTEDASDAELVARASEGEQRAFSLLMARHKDATYRFIRRYGVDREEAYDLVQQTFVSAWSSLRRFDRERPFATWLRAIALNKCRDWSRRAAVRRFLLSPLSLDSPAAESAPDPDPDPEATALEQERQRAIAGAIAALPKSLKEPLLLTVLDGFSQKDTASLLGLTPKAVENRVARARKELARALARD